jgi:transposase
MFIRRTQTRNTATGEHYYTYRLVHSVRDGKQVRQQTILNLGRHFDVPEQHWRLLCSRLDQVLGKQSVLVEIECPALVERHAQRLAAQLLAREGESRAAAPAASGSERDIQAVDVDSLTLVRPRSVGVEQVALWAMEQVDFIPLLKQLGLSGPMRAAVVGSVVGRMAAPGSERATYRWLSERSALGELLDVDYETMRPEQLYRASDVLFKHRSAIEGSLFNRISELFGLGTTVTLYDLTNTYFEGDARGNDKARRGHSKEKRSDCPLLTLALMLDGSGFVRRSEVFAGNAVESQTLEEMLTGLAAPQGSLVVMDRGIASAANLAWLAEHGYRYLVVSRERNRQFDPQQALTLETAGAQSVSLQKVLSEDGREVRLYCYSEQRAEKENGIERRFAERFEAELQKLQDGLSRPRTHKQIDKLWERIGRLKERSRGAAQHYHIEILPDESGTQAAAIRWTHQPKAGSRQTHPGVYCLRSNELGWDEEQMWRNYVMLTDLEAVFRSLKSELGLRPIYHHKASRCDAHLFITVLAYQFVQIIRRRLQAQGITERWSGLRERLAGQCRVTTTFVREDGRTLHVRKATRAEPAQVAIYRGLDLDPAPGGIRKMIV